MFNIKDFSQAVTWGGGMNGGTNYGLPLTAMEGPMGYHLGPFPPEPHIRRQNKRLPLLVKLRLVARMNPTANDSVLDRRGCISHFRVVIMKRRTPNVGLDPGIYLLSCMNADERVPRGCTFTIPDPTYKVLFDKTYLINGTWNNWNDSRTYKNVEINRTFWLERKLEEIPDLPNDWQIFFFSDNPDNNMYYSHTSEFTYKYVPNQT